jgi:hypothetical protein
VSWKQVLIDIWFRINEVLNKEAWEEAIYE